ncbi:hypothetical protein QQZ08_007252 [Neonectria magnoliae]|uniref:Uncharacterized protein n=1 Tax=Neonectria magnoliae TaxID=2732573 RepID=A0ABR1HYD5_9HYPO
MQDQWNNSADKRDLESNISSNNSKRMMELLDICLHIYNCSPPGHHLTLESSSPPADSHRKRYTTVNMVNSLVTVLQFAVICRTDDRRMPAEPKCNTLKRSNDALRIADGPLERPIRDIHNDTHMAEIKEDCVTSTISNLMCHIRASTKLEKRPGQPTTIKSQGFDVYGLTVADLYTV